MIEAMDTKIRLEALKTALKIDQKKQRIAEIEAEMNAAGFWLDQENANLKTKELKNLKNEIKKYQDLEELVELSEGEDQKIVEEELEKMEVYIYLSGKYDEHSAIINFYAGAGGDDAQDWTEMLLKMYLHWAEKNNYSAKILDKSQGGIAGIKSATLEIDGSFVYGKLKFESGAHRLVRQSPFNAKSLRQTSFSLVEVLPKIEKDDNIEIEDKDLKIDTFHASGHGGQSVNTTNSAVRITHIPTGIVASCQNERSQLQNKANALSVVKSKLAKLLEVEHKTKIDELRGESVEPEWGSQIRSYVLHPYKMVKDHRTEFESHDPVGVLNGDLNDFIDIEIKKLGDRK